MYYNILSDLCASISILTFKYNKCYNITKLYLKRKEVDKKVANGDYEKTHKKILDCGKKIFKDQGFEKSNLRAICKAAGVTTGAFYGHFEDKEALFSELVEPIVSQIQRSYTMYEDRSFDVYKKEKHIKKETIYKILESKAQGAIEMVLYFFEHKDVFELLVFGSYGTKFNNFLDEIIEREDKNHFEILSMIYGEDHVNDVITNRGIHLINHAYFYALSEVAVHSKSIEEVKLNATLISEFFNEGWKKIRGI